MMETKEKYGNMRDRHREELDSFKHWFFAFSEDQFKEGLSKLNAKPEDLYKLPSGGFVLKKHNQELKDMFDRQDRESAEAFKDNEFLLSALVYELCNHEYCITYDESDALQALGLDYTDIPTDIMQKATAIAGACE